MAFEFGIFDHIEKRQDVPLDQQYRERLELLVIAEAVGFSRYHLAEHHNSPLCMAPSQNLFLASLAQRTTTLRFGPLVYLLPMYHPLRLIEEICMLDNLCGGRLEVGVGKGISALEHRFWGNEPTEARGLFEETLDVLIRGLSDDTLTFDGDHYHFDRIPAELRPLQRPYPPLWYAGNVEFAGQHGLNFLGGGQLKNLPRVVERYHELWAEGRKEPAPLNPHVTDPKIGSVRHVIVADTDEEAERIGRRAWAAYHRNFPKRGYEVAADPTTGAGGGAPGGPSLGGNFDLALKVEAALAGSAATVGAFVQRYRAESEMNYFVGSFQWGDITHAEAMRSIELFGAAAVLA